MVAKKAKCRINETKCPPAGEQKQMATIHSMESCQQWKTAVAVSCLRKRISLTVERSWPQGICIY